jgi:hypothetical protein
LCIDQKENCSLQRFTPRPYLFRVPGWIADFFRFWWALFYWNTRKTWFRLKGADRDSCPCQNFSDSGHALDARCRAVELWQKPERFRRVCPLLTQTKEGWRCGVDAERVRPFWGRALLYCGAALFSIHLLGSAAVFTVLRSTGYDVGFQTVVWPGFWPELRVSQEKLHESRAQKSLRAGDFKAAALSLQTVCQLNPRNYSAGIALANLLQIAGQPTVAEHIYNRLMHDVPEERTATARIWIRPLLARGAYAQIKPLAIAMLSEDSEHREAWLHVLLFSARQTRDQAVLELLLKNEHGLPNWCVDLIEVEQLLLAGHVPQAIARLDRIYPAIPYVPGYQVDRLLRLGLPNQALKLVDAYGSRLSPDEASIFRLRAFRAQNWPTLLESEYEVVLSNPMSAALAALLASLLIEQPEPALLARFLDRFMQHGPVLNADTLPIYHAAYLAAVLGGDRERAAKLAATVGRFTSSETKALHLLGQALAQGEPPAQIAVIMPLIPLPLEAIYAIQARPVGPSRR